MYLALGVNLEGHKELLGLWIGEKEGSKFWLSILTELKNRGVRDILIACVDGLTGFPEAIASEFPKTEVQLCMRVGESIPVLGAASEYERYINSDYPQTRRAESAYPTSAGAPGQKPLATAAARR